MIITGISFTSIIQNSVTLFKGDLSKLCSQLLAQFIFTEFTFLKLNNRYNMKQIVVLSRSFLCVLSNRDGNILC